MASNISFDIIARDRASSTFSKISRSSSSAQQRLVKFGKVAALGLAATGVAATALAVKLAKAAAEDQQSSALLAKQFKNSAKATDAQIAATERWISAQGRAKGVADEDLRPALSSLVVATHDVGRAQRLAALAMNVSAGKGLALTAVSKALAKGATGNVGALGRLGIATKDADGKTRSFAAITKDLGKQFAGAASTKANTFAGKVGRLKLILSETGEAIGYKLIPILTDLATWILNKGLPALDRFGKWFQTNIVPPMKQVAGFIEANLIPAFAKVQSMFDRTGKGSGRVGQALSQFKANFASIWASVQSIFVSVSGFAEKFWARYGDLITKYGVTTLRNMLTTVRGVMNVLTGIFKTVAALLKGDWGGAWDGIKQITKGAVQVIRGSVGQLWNQLKTLFSAGGRALADLMRLAWRGILSAAKAEGKLLLAYFKNVPGRLLKALGDLNNLLVGAGKAVIAGFFNGLKSKWEDVAGWVSSRGQWIKDHKGPVSKDRTLLTPAGIAIMEGLIGGLKSRQPKLASVLAKLTAYIGKQADKIADLMSKKSDVISSVKGFGASVFGASFTDADGNEKAPQVGDLLKYQREQLKKAQTLKADIKSLVKKGLSKSLILQLVNAGDAGISQIHALAGGSTGDIKTLNALDKATSAALGAAGSLAGNRLYGNDIKRAQHDKAVAVAIRHELELWRKQEDKNSYIVVEIDSENFIRAVKKRNKAKGVSTAGM